MEKLVRARPKRVEDLPEWAFCCEAFTEGVSQSQEMVVDLSRNETGRMACAFCHADHGVLHGVMDVSDGRLEAVELLDLDEGAEEILGGK